MAVRSFDPWKRFRYQAVSFFLSFDSWITNFGRNSFDVESFSLVSLHPQINSSSTNRIFFMTFCVMFLFYVLRFLYFYSSFYVMVIYIYYYLSWFIVFFSWFCYYTCHGFSFRYMSWFIMVLVLDRSNLNHFIIFIMTHHIFSFRPF